jgi:hypothetical protein
MMLCCSGSICTFITGDVAIPEPTDVCPPKWVCYVIAGAIAGTIIYTSGDDLDDLQDALDAFRNNPDFRRWWHKHWKGDQGFGGGGKKNPDLPIKDILDGWREWIENGAPGGGKW